MRTIRTRIPNESYVYVAFVYDMLQPFDFALQVFGFMLGYALHGTQQPITTFATALALQLLTIISFMVCLGIELVFLFLRGLRWQARLSWSARLGLHAWIFAHGGIMCDGRIRCSSSRFARLAFLAPKFEKTTNSEVIQIFTNLHLICIS